MPTDADSISLKQLRDAMLDAFSHTELSELMLFEMEQPMHHIVAPSQDLRTVVAELIAWAKREARLAELVGCCHQQRPQRQDLHRLAVAAGVAADTPPRDRIEQAIEQLADDLNLQLTGSPAEQYRQILNMIGRELNVTVDVQQSRTSVNAMHPTGGLMQRLDRLTSAVCRIETNQMRSTAFLVGPQVILTAYHVVQHVHAGSVASDLLQARFDCYDDPDGGSVVKMAADWLIDFQPYSPSDMRMVQGQAQGDLPQDDQCDYALLRLAEPFGQARGWLDITKAAEIERGYPLYALHFFQGGTMQLSLDGQVARLNANATRLFYYLFAGPGVSGAPCFDRNWRPAAMMLGRAGLFGDEAELRYGVPLQKVAAQLQARGHGALLS